MPTRSSRAWATASRLCSTEDRAGSVGLRPSSTSVARRGGSCGRARSLRKRCLPPPPEEGRVGASDFAIMGGMLQARTDLTSRIDLVDPEIGAAIRDEYERQQYTLELIPSENIASPAVLQALGSLLNNKYAEGYPGKRYYGGPQIFDPIETLATHRPKALLGPEHAHVQSPCAQTE